MKSHGIWRKYAGSTTVKLSIAVLAVLWMVIVAATWADAAERNSDPESRAAALKAGSHGPQDPTDSTQTLSAEADRYPIGVNRSPAGLSGAERAPAASGDGSNSDDEYNFNWLDPEKKIYVLQNRKYLKANRL